MSRLSTGVPVLDRAWTGLRAGETYVVTGRTQSGLPVLLRAAQTVTDGAQACVYLSGQTPAAFMAQATPLGFDARAAAQAGHLRLLRPPEPGASDKAQAQQMDGLAHLASQTTPALLVVEDFTAFLAFQDLDHLTASVDRLITALHAQPTVLLLGMGAPANDRSAAITERLCAAAAGAIHVEPESDAALTLRLRPGANIALATVTDTWTPARYEEPQAPHAESTGPSGDGFGDGYGDGHGTDRGDGHPVAGQVGDRLLTNRHPAQPAAPPAASSPAPGRPTPTSPASTSPTELPAPASTARDDAMPSVAEMNASLADIFGRAEPQTTPASDLTEAPRDDTPPPAEQPTAPEPPPAPDATREVMPLSTADAPPPVAPDFATPPPSMPVEADLDAPTLPTQPSPNAAMPAAPPQISLLNLTAAAFPVNPHLKSDDFEWDGGVLLDSYQPHSGAVSFDGRQVSTNMGGTFAQTGAPAPGGGFGAPAGFGSGGDSVPLDFSGAPEFDAAPRPPAPRRSASQAPPPPSAMPKFTSLAAHTFDQSPRGQFAKQVQASFERFNAIGTPFLALALRMDPDNPFAEAFPLVEDAVRAALDERDPLYAETDKKRLLALLPQRTQQAAPGVFGAIKNQLQLSGGAIDAVFTAISAVTVPNGEPFANARDLMAFAFDAD
ncbi:MAG: hypothetical protein AAGG50_11425 [Bacteroidota bacterium]